MNTTTIYNQLQNTINFNEDFFSLDTINIELLQKARKQANYIYSGNLGRSVLRNFYYSLQRYHRKQTTK